MKKFLLLICSLQLFFSGACFAQTAQELYTEAQRAYLAGDVEVAKDKFKAVLEMNPKHTGAIGYLRMIAAKEKSSGGGSVLRKQLQTLVLPKVEFRDATFSSALEYLRQQAVKQSGDKVKVSFVVQLPPDITEKQTATLNLVNVPFLEALRYLCEQANVTFSVERFAVVVKKKVAVETAPPQTTPAPAQ